MDMSAEKKPIPIGIMRQSLDIDAAAFAASVSHRIIHPPGTDGGGVFRLTDASYCVRLDNCIRGPLESGLAHASE